MDWSELKHVPEDSFGIVPSNADPKLILPQAAVRSIVSPAIMEMNLHFSDKMKEIEMLRDAFLEQKALIVETSGGTRRMKVTSLKAERSGKEIEYTVNLREADK